MLNVNDMPEELKKIIEERKTISFFRIVDTLKNEVYNVDKNGNLVKKEEKCYNIWAGRKICRNCVADEAAKDKNVKTKLKCKDNEMYIVRAVPGIDKEGRYILEIAEQITNDCYIEMPGDGDMINIFALIEEFNDIVSKDSFTGLYNKSYAKMQLNSLVKLAQKNDMPLVIAVMDINNFKRINDVYGHVAGDEVMLRIAEKFKSIEEENNIWAARIGGDEFMIVFSGLEYIEAEEKIKRVIEEIKNIKFSGQKDMFNIGIAWGMAEYIKGESYNDFFERADMNMYKNKKRTPF